MMSIDQVAKRAYDAHHTALRRTPPLAWEQLDGATRAAWIAAAQAVRRAIEEV